MAKQEERKTYEEFLSQIGGMGLYQKRMLLLGFLACVAEGMHLVSTVFTMGAQEYRCAVPGLLNDTFSVQNEAHARLINATIPFDSDKGIYSQCSRYTFSLNQSTRQMKNETSLETERCSRWVYSTDIFASSIVSELNLVCDRTIYMSHANMMSMAGLMLASLVCGAFSDMFGRKKSFLFFYWFHMIVAFCSVLATTIPAFLITRLLIAGTGLAFYMSIYVLITEMVKPRKRVIAGTCANLGWVFGMLLLLLLAYFLRDWKTLQLALSAPLIFIAFGYFWLIPESPRWLLNKGCYSEAQKIISEMAKVNKKDLPERFLLEELNAERDNDKKEASAQNQKSPSHTKSLILLCTSPIMCVRLVILGYSWAVNSMVYFGVMLNMGSIIPGDIYINFLIMSFLEIVSHLMVPFTLRWVGRKAFYCALVLIGGGACLATILPSVLGTDSDWINISLSNMGKFCISAAFNVIWLYTSELLPTPARQSGIGFCSFIGRVGGMISPYIANLKTLIDGPFGEVAPLIVFGSAALLAGLLCLLLPETTKRKLPETLEEAENINRSK